MNLFQTIVVSLVLGFSSSSRSLVFANQHSKSSIHDDLKQIDQLSVKIKQKRYSSLRKTYFGEAQGEAVFAKPGKFRWTMKTPQKEDTLFDGQTLQQYKEAENSLLRFKQGGSTLNEISRISHIVLNPDAFRESYDTISESKEADLVKLVLKPKKAGEIESIDLKISTKSPKNPASIRSLEITYAGGNKWNIEFQDPSYQAVDARIFSFEVPKNTKITDVQ